MLRQASPTEPQGQQRVRGPARARAGRRQPHHRANRSVHRVRAVRRALAGGSAHLPKRFVHNLVDLDDAELDGFAQIYLDVLGRFDRMYPKPLPYISALHQYGDNDAQREGYFHVELMSIRRSADKLKYLAASESAMDAFISDVTPESVAQRLRELLTRSAYAAPGRINLIGEHTDYNLGFALPIALPEPTVVTFAPSDTDAISVRSDAEHGQIQIPLDTTPGGVTGWAAYVAGVVWALRRAGQRVPGGDVSVASGVEIGSGLASSAALECAVLGAIIEATGATSTVSSRPRTRER